MTDQKTEATQLGVGFRDPDSSNAEALIRYLDSVATDPFTAAKRKLKEEVLAIKAGESVLDVGCGAGADLLAMAVRVGSTGSVTGVDVSRAMVDTAAARANEAGLANVSVQLIDGKSLPFPDGTFDVVHSERVLILAEDPDRLLR